MPPSVYSDLTIERVLPINEQFSCEIDNEAQTSQNPDVVLNVTYGKLEFMINIEPGIESSNFVAELFRSIEVGKTKSDFQWLRKYLGTESAEAAAQNNIMQEQLGSGDITIHRQKIAQGHVNARDSILSYHMDLKESEFTNTQKFRIFVGTWNVNGKSPTVGLDEWLGTDEIPPDVYAIGFQELDLSKEAFLFNDTPKEAEWQFAVQKSLHRGAEYNQIALIRLVGMLLIVHVKKELYSFVKNIAADTVGTGIMGKMGNKGGVAIRLQLHNTTLCFVNSHLAAHMDEVERRNQDYNDICLRVNFRRYPQTIKDHQQIYWLGDLNYRIMDLTTQQVKDCIANSNMSPVLASDQLTQQYQKGLVFVGYTEGPITFLPTYKYDPGTDSFDTSEKARAPAWCDRVLWRGSGISQVAYRSHPQLRISDHKPVSAVFRSDIKVVDQTKYRKIQEEILKKMDKLENEFLPQVTVDTTEVVFKNVKFLEPQFRDIIIANTGQVPVNFEFINKLDEKSYCKEWLKITPYNGNIKPGQKCDVHFEVQLDSPQENLYDILVLHLQGGKDVFITVSAECQRTCFTTSFSALYRTSVPIAHLTPDQLENAERERAPALYVVPRELWLLVDHLYRHGLRQRGLFESHSLNWQLIQVRDWLDNGAAEPPPSSAHVVAEALLLLLSYSAEPVIPYHLHSACIAVASTYASCKQVVQKKLSKLHRDIFLYICLFLQELLQYTNDNGLDAKTLATVFGDVLLRDPVRNSRPQANRAKADFVHQFLKNDLSQLIAS